MATVIYGQNATTPGAVGLSSTFQCISVKANFSGDGNANNSCSVQYRVTGSSTFLDAYTPLIDRRSGSDPFVNQARVSIVGLTPNTSYDVKVTWSDPDGVSGSASSTTTIRTLSYNYPTGGSTITVTGDSSLASALSSVSPGQTIHLNPASYSPITINNGGNASAYIVIEGDSGGGSTILGAGVNQNVQLNANYVVIKNITFGPSDHSGLTIPVGGHHIYVQDCNFQNISTTCPGNLSGNYADAGIAMGTFSGGSSCSNIFILRNGIHSTALMNSACTASPNYDSPGEGVIWHGLVNTLVVQSNTVDGGFRDGITCDDDETTENVDMNGNVVSNYKDDPVESKGLNVNIRVWGNYITNTTGNTCGAFNATSSSTPLAGPCYLFRNFVYVAPGNGLGGGNYKLSYSYCAPTFIFHNTVMCTGTGGWDGYEVGDTITVRNSIMQNTGNGIYTSPTTSSFDYNLYNVGGSIASHWGSSSYSTISDWRSGAGQEMHGLQTDPLLKSDLSVPLNSPAVNAGVAIPNFNGPNSAWPYTNAAPTIGAFEFVAGSGGTGNPNPPTNLHVVSSGP